MDRFIALNHNFIAKTRKYLKSNMDRFIADTQYLSTINKII